MTIRYANVGGYQSHRPVAAYQFSQHYKRPALTCPGAVAEGFSAAGNVRQLSNIIERLVLSGRSHSQRKTLDEAASLDDLEEADASQSTCHDCQMLAGDYKTIRLRILRKLGRKGIINR